MTGDPTPNTGQITAEEREPDFAPVWDLIYRFVEARNFEHASLTAHQFNIIDHGRYYEAVKIKQDIMGDLGKALSVLHDHPRDPSTRSGQAQAGERGAAIERAAQEMTVDRLSDEERELVSRWRSLLEEHAPSLGIGDRVRLCGSLYTDGMATITGFDVDVDLRFRGFVVRPDAYSGRIHYEADKLESVPDEPGRDDLCSCGHVRSEHYTYELQGNRRAGCNACEYSVAFHMFNDAAPMPARGYGR